MKTALRLALIVAVVAVVAGCESFTPPGRAAAPEPNRSHYFSTSHWPYANSMPFVQIPAQFTAGLPFFPSMIGLMPYTIAVQKKTDLAVAFIDAETIYMETPGYLIYRAAGFPFHCVQYALVDQPVALYRDWSRGTVADETDIPDSGDDE